MEIRDEEIKYIWKSVKAVYDDLKDTMPINFHDDEFAHYEQNIYDLFEQMKKEHMKRYVKTLDRHNLTALIIIALASTDFVTYNNLPEGKHFIGKQLIAINVALEYMKTELNCIIVQLGYQPINDLIFPVELSGDIPYFTIMARNLYLAMQSKQDAEIIALELSERLYLLEYINLQENKIDVKKLKDFEQEK